MRIDIQARGLELTEDLRNHAERRFRYALKWAYRCLHKISIRLSDENGPRGGEDKRCRIQVVIPGSPDLVVEETKADLLVAIDRAADRIGNSLARRLQRRRKHSHAVFTADGLAVPAVA